MFLFIYLFWHKRLGQITYYILQRLKFCKKGSNDIITSCYFCSISKQQRLAFPQSHVHSTTALKLIHLDLWDPYKVAFISRAH